MLNLKTIFKQKSKILLTIICIFGLAFSYSCSCRADKVTGGGGPTEKEFSASVSGTVQDTLRVDSQSQKKAGTEDIKISFSAAKGVNTVENFLVTIEKVEVKGGGLELGTNADDYKNYLQYDKSTGIIRFEKKGLDAIGALSSATAPVDKTVSITFKIDGGEQGSDYITRDFHLIKIKKIEEGDMQGILQKMEYSDNVDIGSYDDLKGATFTLSMVTYDRVQGEYTIKNTTSANTPRDTFDEAAIKKLQGDASYYLKKLSETSDDELTPTNDSSKFIGKSTYTAEYTIKWADDYESTITTIKITFDMAKKN